MFKVYLFYTDILAKPFELKAVEDESKTMKLTYAFPLCCYILSVKWPSCFLSDSSYFGHPTARPYITVVPLNSRKTNPTITSYLIQQDLYINIHICE